MNIYTETRLAEINKTLLPKLDEQIKALCGLEDEQQERLFELIDAYVKYSIEKNELMKIYR